MSIIIKQTPQLIKQVYSPMFFMVDSTYSTEDPFRYMFELYTLDGLIVSKNCNRFPNNYGRIDVSIFLKNELSFDNSIILSSGLNNTKNSILQYDLAIGYSGSTHSLDPNYNYTGNKYVLNGVDNYLDFDLNNYIMSASTSSMLSSTPTNISVYTSDYFSLSFLNGVFSGNTVSSVKYINVKVYSGNTNTIYQITNPDYQHIPNELENVDKMYKTFGCGPIQLQNYITPNTTKYDIYTTNNSGVITSKIYTFTINRNEPRYSKNQIVFLNRFGNWSYFTFTSKVSEVTKTERTTFQKNRYDLVNDTWMTSKSSRGTTLFNNIFNKEYIFTSSFIDQNTYDHMEELFTSPEVYWIKNNELISIVLTDKEFINRKVINDKLINFSITFELANRNKLNL